MDETKKQYKAIVSTETATFSPLKNIMGNIIIVQYFIYLSVKGLISDAAAGCILSNNMQHAESSVRLFTRKFSNESLKMRR